MEAIGEMLRNAREAKKLTIKEISNDTNISSKYLNALENEEFDKLPGETYILGFLKSYAEYLRIDSEEIIHCYKGYKIGESTTPLEELTKSTAPIALANITNIFFKYKNVCLAAGSAVLLLLIIWFFSAIFSSDIEIEDDESLDSIKKEQKVSKKKYESGKIRSLKLTNDRGYILVYKKEAVQFLVDNKEVMFSVKDIFKNAVELEVLPGKLFRIIEMEKPEFLNIEDCNRQIVLTLKGLTENRAKIFVMLGKKISQESGQEVTAGSDVAAQTAERTVIAQNRKNLKIIFEAEFIRKTYLELYLDGVQKKKGIIPSGIKERWEAAENIQFKIGNAGGLKAKINGKSYTFGLPGQVANKVITWKKDLKNPNLYHIVIKDW